jgi:hypothetical protein
MIRITRAMSALLLAVSAAAAAQETEPVETIPVGSDAAEPVAGDRQHPSYSYASLGWRTTDYDDAKADGFVVEGSWLWLPSVYLVGAYRLMETDQTPAVESSLFEFGAGYRMPIRWDLDLAVGARVLRQETNPSSDFVDELGWQVEAGVRRMFTDYRIEGAARLTYVELGGYNQGNTSLSGHALYQLMPQLSAGLELGFGNKSTSYGLLARWTF